MQNNLSFNLVERAWLKSLIRADINDVKEMVLLPIEDVGQSVAAFAQLRIENMESLLSKLEAADALEKQKQNTKRKAKKQPRKDSDYPFRTHPKHFIDSAPASSGGDSGD